ncbi:MAG: protein kinase [Deltaproteobacteria bacterium]|nr:protein kinase [Deltaproteobacteria bacterium]
MARALVLLSLLVVFGCDEGSAPRAIDGVLDLRGREFDDRSVLSLQGGWTFYWEKLIEPGDHAKPDGVLPIGRWNGQELGDGRELGGHGFATYRLIVHLPDDPRQYALDAAPVLDATKLLVSRPDGTLLAGPLRAGTVGTTRETSRGTPRNAIVSFTAGGTVLLTFQVSNFEHARGGSGPAPVLGAVETIGARERHRRMADFFVLGLLILVGVQQLVQFALNRADRASLWFALVCLVIAARVFILGRYPADEVSGFWTVTSLRLEYLTGYLGAPLIALFVRAVFPTYVHPLPVYVLCAAGLVFTASLALPPPIFTLLQSPFQMLIFAALAFAVVSLTRAVIGTRDVSSVLVLVGFVLLALAVAWDVLRVRRAVQPLFGTTQYGLSGFVLCQSTVLALLNRRRSRELEQRNREVQLLNEELREQIANRSHELSHALALMASPNPAARTLDPGTVLAEKYRIGGLLGEGGMGKVYRAERLADGRSVAIKLVRGGNPKTLARFAREAELVARIDHPNVVSVLDFGITDQAVLFLVLELVEGNSLEHAHDRFGDLRWAVPMVAQLAKAIETIHLLGVVHRDIKPGNVLVAGDVLKLTDFGVAHVERPADPERAEAKTVELGMRADHEQTATVNPDPNLTKVGVVIGSPLYMAPELSQGADHATPRSDLFSFGIVAYEMLGGKRPFDRPVAKAFLKGRPAPDPPVPLATLAPGLPADVAAVIDDCLQLDPGARPDAATVARIFGDQTMWLKLV